MHLPTSPRVTELEIHGAVYVIEEFYGTATVRYADGRMLAFSDDVEKMIKTTLGSQALTMYERKIKGEASTNALESI